MRVAIYQGPEQVEDIAATLAMLDRQAEQAAREGANLLVCSEMFLTGYAIGGEAAARLAETADGPSAVSAAAIARRHQIALVYGYPERAPDGVYNAALLIDADGRTLLRYRKSHLFGELDRSMFVPGSAQSCIVELGGLRVGLLICYDVEFPENVRALALAGADLVLVPTAQMEPYDFVNRCVVPVRAWESQLAIVYANRCGREGDLVYVGQSCIVGADGADLARAGRKEALILADITADAIQRGRRLNSYLADRRPDLYGGPGPA
jgi:predicted amidohydrolase